MESPTFDQLGPDRSLYSMDERLGEAFGALLQAEATRATTTAQLDAFEEALFVALGELDEYGLLPSYLGVDYGPGRTLAEAAKKAGLPERQFPIKTSMHVRPSYVSFSVGYGAPHTYHYPMDERRWLLTTLTGSDADVEALIALARYCPERFTIETDDA